MRWGSLAVASTSACCCFWLSWPARARLSICLKTTCPTSAALGNQLRALAIEVAARGHQQAEHDDPLRPEPERSHERGRLLAFVDLLRLRLGLVDRRGERHDGQLADRLRRARGARNNRWKRGGRLRRVEAARRKRRAGGPRDFRLRLRLGFELVFLLRFRFGLGSPQPRREAAPRIREPLGEPAPRRLQFLAERRPVGLVARRAGCGPTRERHLLARRARGEAVEERRERRQHPAQELPERSEDRDQRSLLLARLLLLGLAVLPRRAEAAVLLERLQPDRGKAGVVDVRRGGARLLGQHLGGRRRARRDRRFAEGRLAERGGVADGRRIPERRLAEGQRLAERRNAGGEGRRVERREIEVAGLRCLDGRSPGAGSSGVALFLGCGGISARRSRSAFSSSASTCLSGRHC